MLFNAEGLSEIQKFKCASQPFPTKSIWARSKQSPRQANHIHQN